MYWEKAYDRGLAAREGSLINIADRVDVDLRAKNDFREAVEGADRRVCERRPGIYSPDHIEAMQDILHDEETLNDLAGAHIRLPAFVRRRYGDQILTPQETIQFSTLFRASSSTHAAPLPPPIPRVWPTWLWRSGV